MEILQLTKVEENTSHDFSFIYICFNKGVFSIAIFKILNDKQIY